MPILSLLGGAGAAGTAAGAAGAGATYADLLKQQGPTQRGVPLGQANAVLADGGPNMGQQPSGFLGSMATGALGPQGRAPAGNKLGYGAGQLLGTGIDNQQRRFMDMFV